MNNTEKENYEIDFVVSWMNPYDDNWRREKAMMDVFVEKAKKMGANKIIGIYLPTAKNAMVKKFYGEQGFGLIEENEDGSRWELNIQDYQTQNEVIEIKE